MKGKFVKGEILESVIKNFEENVIKLNEEIKNHVSENINKNIKLVVKYQDIIKYLKK